MSATDAKAFISARIAYLRGLEEKLMGPVLRPQVGLGKGHTLTMGYPTKAGEIAAERIVWEHALGLLLRKPEEPTDAD